MATPRWMGHAPPIAQVQSYVLAGTWNAADIITLTIGNVAKTFVTGSTAIDTIGALLVTTWNALTAALGYPQFAEITAAYTAASDTVTLTADTAGKPFTATISTNSALGTINGASSSTGTATTASSGPNDWSTAANWSGNAVPANSDSIYIENSDVDILYGLSPGITPTLVQIDLSFTGKIGLPRVNSDGTEYDEYRAQYLTFSTTTTCNVGVGAGTGSGRIKLAFGSATLTTLNVRGTGSREESDVPALCVTGTAITTANVFGGDVGFGHFGSESVTITTLNIDGSSTVRVGTGGTLTTVNADDGEVELNVAATTLTIGDRASVTVIGTGAYTTITLEGGSLDYRSSGTITTLNIGSNSQVDFSNDNRARTATTTTLFSGGSIQDPAATVTWTNGILFSRCRNPDVSVDAGVNRTWTIT